jgi:hypothetical protein
MNKYRDHALRELSPGEMLWRPLTLLVEVSFGRSPAPQPCGQLAILLAPVSVPA